MNKVPQSMRGRIAQLTITANGEISKVSSAYLIIHLYNEKKEESVDRTVRYGDKSYICHIRTIFWKTDHKQVWFCSNEVLDVECVDGNWEPVNLGESVNLDTKLPSAGEKLIEFVEKIVMPIEVKDFWLNAARQHICSRLHDYFSLNPSIFSDKTQKMNSYFMLEESYLAWKTGNCHEVAACDDSTSIIENYKKMYPKALICYDPDNNKQYTLFDLPLSHWISGPESNPVPETPNGTASSAS